MTKKKYASKTFENKNIYTILVVLLSAFMLIIPFYRGLFFRSEYLPAVAFISIVFAAYMFISLKDRTDGLITYMDVSVLLIPVAYLISFFFAVNAKDSFDMFILYSSYFMLYRLVSALSIRDDRYKNVFINLIIASSFILSFTSILNISGIINLHAAFEGRRLFGPYQYPNTTASVLGVGIILSLNKLINEGSIKLKAAYQAILTALLPSFISTLSRGGYLVLAVVLLLNFFLIKAKEKVKLLLGLLISFLSSALYIYKYYTLPEGAFSIILVHYLISIALSVIIVYIVYSQRKLIKLRLTDKAINLSLIALAALFAGVIVFLFSVKEPAEYRIEHSVSEEWSTKNEIIAIHEVKPDSQYTIEFDVKASMKSQYSYGIIIFNVNSANESTEILNKFESTGLEYTRKSFFFKTLKDTEMIRIYLYNCEPGSYTVYKNVVIRDSKGKLVQKMERYKYIPQAIAERLTDINLRTENVTSRLRFAKDSMKIIKDYPIIGAGGGAWRNLYKQYQSMPYNTSEVHNFYMQYGTEVGIIGLAVLIGLLILLVISMIRNIRNGSHYLYVYLAAMLLFLHSGIDFNLSLPAVAFILWMLIGIINSDKYTPLIEKAAHRYMLITALTFALAVCFSSSAMRYGMKLGAKAAMTSQAKMDVNTTIGLYKKAAALDRFNAMYRIDLAQIMNKELKETKDRKYYDGVMEQISLIRKYEPHNHQFTSVICNIYLSLGKFEEASELVDFRAQDEPLIAQSYKSKIDVNFEIVKYYAKNNTMQEAIPYLREIAEAKEQIERINAELQEPIVLDENTLEKVEASLKALEAMK
jgi:O-antigen ligase